MKNYFTNIEIIFKYLNYQVVIFLAGSYTETHPYGPIRANFVLFASLRPYGFAALHKLCNRRNHKSLVFSIIMS
jgi:hypothetical protein